MLLAFTSAVAALSTPWVANFFDEANGQALCALVKGQRTTADCDHSSVVYDPSDDVMARLSKGFGARATLRALAVASDGHARAAMLHLEAGPAEALSSNEWPHVTVAAGGYPYSPVYSNCLWARAVAASNATITRDNTGKPVAISLPAMARVWSGVLPASPCAEEGGKLLPATNGTIELLLTEEDTVGTASSFNATLCSNGLWDRSSGRCNVGSNGRADGRAAERAASLDVLEPHPEK